MRHQYGIIALATATCISVARIATSQVVTSATHRVTVSSMENSTIAIKSLSPPFGPYAQFDIKCENSDTQEIKATVFCDLVFTKDGKESHDAFSFHDLTVPTGVSTATVVFATFNLQLHGEGNMKVYLANHIAPDPKPPRAFYMAIGGEVCSLEKPVSAVYTQLQLQLISNTELLPVKTAQ